MTAAASVHFPSSRTLAAWWPDLRPLQPEALWVCHLVLHRLEAAVEVASVEERSPLERSFLEAVAEGSEMTLGLDPALSGRWLAELAARGLVTHQGSWKLTAAGMAVLRGEQTCCPTVQRRVFYFQDQAPAARYLFLNEPPTTSWPASDDWRFDITWLEKCVGRPIEWKVAHNFPLDVLGVVKLADSEVVSEERWQRLAVDRPEQLSLVLVLSQGEEGERLRGFAIQPTTWQLQRDRPVLTLGRSWREVMPEIVVQPELEQWRQAWRNWGQPRSLPAADLDECTLEQAGAVLRVHAPNRLIERLRGLSSDAIKGEAWLLSGDDHTRRVALVELVPQE